MLLCINLADDKWMQRQWLTLSHVHYFTSKTCERKVLMTSLCHSRSVGTKEHLIENAFTVKISEPREKYAHVIPLGEKNESALRGGDLRVL